MMMTMTILTMTILPMIDMIMMIMLKTTKNAQHVLSSDFFDQGLEKLLFNLD